MGIAPRLPELFVAELPIADRPARFTSSPEINLWIGRLLPVSLKTGEFRLYEPETTSPKPV